MNYKEEIIKLINNEENKKILSELNEFSNLKYFIKEYTRININLINDYEVEYNNLELKNLYHKMNNILERIKIKNKFYKYYKKDLDEVKTFINKYEDVFNFSAQVYFGDSHNYKRNKLNKLLNEDINHDSIIYLVHDIKKDFYISKSDPVEINSNQRGIKRKFRERKNTEALHYIYKKYKKDYQSYL